MRPSTCMQLHKSSVLRRYSVNAEVTSCLEKNIAKNMSGGKKLFIGGLPSDCDQKALGNAFTSWEISDVIVVFDRETRRSRNFGYVTFVDEKDASDAMKQMGGESGKGKEIFGRALNIEYAQDKEAARQNRRGGGGPRGPPRGPPRGGPPRGPPGRGPPYRDMPPRGGPPPPRRGQAPSERDGPYRGGYDSYERPPPDRRMPPPERSGYPPSREYDRGGYDRERERPPSYGSERGYGDKYPPPDRSYSGGGGGSSGDHGYGPPADRYDSGAGRGYGGERGSYPDRYGGERYQTDRGYDRGSYGGSERGYGSDRGYGGGGGGGGAPYERSGYGPPPERSPSGGSRPGFGSPGGSYSSGGRNW